jgi:synaptotagmin-like protein
VKEESMSVNSTLSDISGYTNVVPVRGEVQFAVQFNEQGTSLEINIKQCRDLAAVDARRNRSDP